MPGIDGYETTRRIRQEWDEDEKRPWIVALTANAMWEDRLRCTEAGMNDFISKPAKLADVRAAISRFMERRTSFSPLPSPVPDSEADAVISEDVSTNSASE